MDGSTHLPQHPLRPASDVMRLERLGAMMPTRLSFLRVLMRTLADQNAVVTRPVWDMDANGFGHAVYTLALDERPYSLVAFSQALSDADRSDRVIATAWDAAFVLFDGVPDATEIARLKANAPLQEGGRFGPRDLVLSRANKSVRLFAHVVEALRAGQQPDAQTLRQTGYLMRTTAVYGNGKFGLADRTTYCDRPALSGPFMAEMLAVWLIRAFTVDLAEHLGGRPMERALKRSLGVGNATGLGMAPFLVSHPLLLDAWFSVRETALARVLAQDEISAGKAAELRTQAQMAAEYLDGWKVPDPDAAQVIENLRGEWASFCEELPELTGHGALQTVWDKAQTGSIPLQELTFSWLLEPFGDLVDGLADCLATPFSPVLKPKMICSEVRDLIQSTAPWVLNADFEREEDQAQFWYVSEAKLEPRLGDRQREPGADRETPLDTARQAANLMRDLPDDDTPLWQFLASHPQHRAVAQRMQALPAHPYAEVQCNILGREAAPIHLLRAKLSMFGATGFDPKSRLWTRVTLAKGLPLIDEIGTEAPWLPT
ncbi:hypothetical protein [Shimia ponticola]|uniref:hypothetical protein n=1 Tax=Shimia ponticola TaxID=2582893 RepID=UPI0011BF924D|nr:hypothetical protein [Shimia ponticola]